MDSYALSKFTEYGRWGRLADLEDAIRSMEQIVHGTPETHESWAGLLHNLGILLQARFERQGRMQDLEQAIDKSERALKVTPKSHSNFTNYLISLSNKLQIRFERTGRSEDLEDAIRKAEKALESLSEGHPYTAGCSRDLSVKMARRYELFGRSEDLDGAIKLAEQATKATPENDPESAPMLHNLANMYQDRFASTGSVENLKSAIVAATKAVYMTPVGHPNNADMSSSLAAKLMKRFEVLGEMEDLEEAIRIAEHAVNTTTEDHPYLAGYLITLGHVLWRRFERTGRSEDLEDAIHKVKNAVKATPRRSPHFAVRSNSLGAMLYTRYERAGNMEDLQDAVLATEDAITATPSGHPRLNMYLSNLSVLLVNRFERSGKPNDLEDAIKRAGESVRATREGHPSRAARWNNLGTVLKRRFEQKGVLEDLEQAIQSATYSVKTTPEDHIDLSGRLNNLGYCLSLSPQQNQWGQALECFQKSWKCVNGVPFHRVDAARQAVRLLKQRRQWSEAANISKEAIDLLPIMNNRSLDRQDQQYVLSKFSGLISDACSLSLQIGDDAEEALKLLERGRGVIMSLLIEDRSDISQVRALHPVQAALYDRIRIELSRSTQETGGFNAPDHKTRNRLALMAQFRECVDAIRQLPGFERFLLGPTSEELMSLAKQGPIAVVNVTDLRSDAFIISPSAIKCIELPGMTSAKVIDWAGLNSDMSKDYITRNKEYRQFLKDLWSECVKHVLDEAHINKGSERSLARMWWVGVGNASSLPFHAAGDHSSGSTENTASWVISSYIPTLKALSYAREQAWKENPGDSLPKFLIIAMPETPGEAPLHYTADELLAVQLATSGAFSSIPLVQPNAKSVLAHLGQCNMVHFACHGVSDHIDPLNSYLVLQDDTSPTPKIDKITVRQISEASLSNARIAYLSACSTAENKAKHLADEVINLASGFQVAGFSHVVASMWVADDQVCVQVAKGFYEHLVTVVSAHLGNEAIAAALHGSVEKIRGRYSKAPLQWAPFIHIGA
jgi:tetratricopeptide (TPR) repeat protein